MRDASIAVEDLMLDVANPRHDQVDGQREAIAALLNDAPEKLVVLARSIADEGLSPIDKLLVMDHGKGLFTVLEGNRRVATLKLLRNPDLAKGDRSEQTFRELGRSANVPREVSCAVANSREEARTWLELRHGGEQGGAGVVNWSAEASQRFSQKSGSQAGKAVTALDSIKAAFPANEQLQSDLLAVRKNRLTTFGRLVSDPDVRHSLGVSFADGVFLVHYDSHLIEPLLARVLADLAGEFTVTEIKSKQQRREYVESIRDEIPAAANYSNEPAPLGECKSPSKKSHQKRKKQEKASPLAPLFDDLVLQNLGSRVQEILNELRCLDLDLYPNAAGVLVRVILELSVDQFYAERGWTAKGTLKTRIQECLGVVDSTGRDKIFQAIRTGLNDGMLAVSTLHAYVHNSHYRPTAAEVRAIASNYKPFLSALDSKASREIP